MASVAGTTEALYAARIRSLTGRRVDLRLSDPGPWVAELQRRDLALSSLKSYASAVRYHVRRKLPEPEDFVTRFDALLRPIQSVARTARKRRRPSIGSDVIDGLRRAARYRDGQSIYTRAAVDLAEGSWRFGLRPSEWGHCAIQGGALHVRNGKFLRRRMAHGIFAGRFFSRANGRYRTLEPTSGSLDDAGSQLISRIRSFQAARPFERHHRAVQIEFRQVVRLAVRRGLIPPRFGVLTLYSFRHQFAADGKRTFAAGSGSVAALMGHISVRTALQSYARRRSGTGRSLGIRPSADSLAAVENLTVFERVFDSGRPVYPMAGQADRGDVERLAAEGTGGTVDGPARPLPVDECPLARRSTIKDNGPSGP